MPRKPLNKLNSADNNLETRADGQHPISSKDISPSALKVMKRLNSSGFTSYLVGGGVRDLLLNKPPKDFDVATDATPEQIKELFRNARIIGRRFRIVHVRYGREIIEVTTFRDEHKQVSSQHSQQGLQSQSGQLLRDNVYGDIESDVLRRDFTVNALYYSAQDSNIYDYVNGLEDIELRQLRMIGSPEVRYREDPVRLLRAIRFAAKLDFAIESETAAPIIEQSTLLANVSAARLFDEVLKLLLGGYAAATLQLLYQYGLFEQLFPATAEVMDQNPLFSRLIEIVMVNTDERIHSNKRVTPAFIFAALLWPPMIQSQHKLTTESGLPPMLAFTQAARAVIDTQLTSITVPKRFLVAVWQIWELQWRLPKRRGKRAEQLVENPRFRAAYDFLLVREAAGEKLDNLGDWWTRYQEGDDEQRSQMVSSLSGNRARR